MGFLIPSLPFLLAFTYLPITLILVEGLSTLPSLLNPENANALRVTLLYVLVVTPLSVVGGLLAALAVNGESRLRLFARALVFHPVLLPGVSFAAVWLFLLNPLGPFSGLLRILGWQNPLGDPTGAFFTIVTVGILKDLGLYMLYFLAGLQALPYELFEAARVDGASSWLIFRRILLPLLSPTTFFVGVMAALGALKNADHIFLLTQGGPIGATDHILFRIYTVGFGYYNFGEASALSLLLLLALTLLAVAALPRLERGVHYEG